MDMEVHGWHHRAACRRYPTSWWFTDEMNDHHQVSDAVECAKRICDTECPVKAECLAEIMNAEGATSRYGRNGIWAGLDGEQRALLYKRTREQQRKERQRKQEREAA